MGGYYDAGDNVKFGWPMAFTVSLLGLAATEYQKEISSAGQLANLRSAIRWGTDFIIRSHTSPTTFYTQVYIHILSCIYIHSCTLAFIFIFFVLTSPELLIFGYFSFGFSRDESLFRIHNEF